MSELIEKAERLLNEITAGDWAVEAKTIYTDRLNLYARPLDCIVVHSPRSHNADLEFIAAAPELVRELIERVKELEASLGNAINGLTDIFHDDRTSIALKCIETLDRDKPIIFPHERNRDALNEK